MMGQAGKGKGMFCNKMCVYDTVMNVNYDKINFNSKKVSGATRLMTSYIVAGFVFAIKFYYIVQLHSSFLVWRSRKENVFIEESLFFLPFFPFSITASRFVPSARDRETERERVCLPSINRLLFVLYPSAVYSEPSSVPGRGSIRFGFGFILSPLSAPAPSFLHV